MKKVIKKEKTKNKRRLYLPLYIFFTGALLVTGVVTLLFELYSRADFKTILNFIKERREVLTLNSDVDHIEIDFHNEADIWNAGGSVYSKPNYNKDLAAKYPVYNLRHASYLFILLLVFWLWPVYRKRFGGKSVDQDLIRKRLVNLPVLVLAVPWIMGLYNLLFQLYFNAQFLGGLNNKLTGIYIVNFFVFGTLVNYFNMGITNRYIYNRIAADNLDGSDLYALKSGTSIKLGLRIALLIFSVAVIPLLLMFYIPLSFNSSLIEEIFNAANTDVVEATRVLIPLVAMLGVVVFYIITQITAIVSLKKSIIKPINQLIRRMKDVAAGDFSTRSSVLSADEIGQLKGHFNSMVEGLEEREKLRDTFGKFVSMEIAEKIMNTGSVQLSGEEIETTVMFTDIRNFTPLSEQLQPRELIEFLNDYFSFMVKPIQEEQGVINKFLGDSIMAVFSPVFGVENHAEAAVKAALKLRFALKEFNNMKKYSEIKHGVGLHTGMLIAGNIGAEERKEYTVVGDTVNIASRIESQTKVFDTDILLSDNLLSRLNPRQFAGSRFIPFKPVKMKGKSTEITLYKVEN